jgi:hypothetical protein
MKLTNLQIEIIEAIKSEKLSKTASRTAVTVVAQRFDPVHKYDGRRNKGHIYFVIEIILDFNNPSNKIYQVGCIGKSLNPSVISKKHYDLQSIVGDFEGWKIFQGWLDLNNDGMPLKSSRMQRKEMYHRFSVFN